jgi:hypothetical protein
MYDTASCNEHRYIISTYGLYIVWYLGLTRSREVTPASLQWTVCIQVEEIVETETDGRAAK